MRKALLGCPFCGGVGRILITATGYSVLCTQCGAEGAKKYDRDQAAEAWNRRREKQND